MNDPELSPLEPRPTTLSVPLDPQRDHLLGPLSAPVVLLEYGDYECPDCGRAYPMLKDLKAQFGEKLTFAFRHFPLFTVHRHASVAAQAAEAAHAQGRFWDMHNLLYEHQDSLVPLDLTHHAIKLGLDVYRFDSALSTGAYIRHVEADYASGKASGVRGTPTLFINDERYAGEVSLDSLSGAISKILMKS